MPDDLKISAMTPITGANIAADDVIPVVDVSTSTNRNITRDEYLSEVKRVIFSRTNYDAAPEEGVLTWDADEKTLSLGLNGGDTVLQIGQESHIRVRNNSGALIANGTVVMQVGTIGNSGRLTIAKAVADGSVDGHRILGITTEDIANGADGLVTNFGKVRQINTTAFADGAVLYANPAVPGGMTATRPAHPNAVVVVAFVVHSHANGTLFVHPSYESQPEMVTLTGTQTLTNKTMASLLMTGAPRADGLTADGRAQFVADLGVSPSAYADRAAALAAPLAVVQQTISFYGPDGLLRHLKRDASGTAMIRADGSKWSPADTVTPEHWADAPTYLQLNAAMQWAIDNSRAFEARGIYILADGFTLRMRGNMDFDVRGAKFIVEKNTYPTTRMDMIRVESGGDGSSGHTLDWAGGFFDGTWMPFPGEGNSRYLLNISTNAAAYVRKFVVEGFKTGDNWMHKPLDDLGRVCGGDSHLFYASPKGHIEVGLAVGAKDVSVYVSSPSGLSGDRYGMVTFDVKAINCRRCVQAKRGYHQWSGHLTAMNCEEGVGYSQASMEGAYQSGWGGIIHADTRNCRWAVCDREGSNITYIVNSYDIGPYLAESSPGAGDGFIPTDAAAFRGLGTTNTTAYVNTHGVNPALTALGGYTAGNFRAITLKDSGTAKAARGNLFHLHASNMGRRFVEFAADDPADNPDFNTVLYRSRNISNGDIIMGADSALVQIGHNKAPSGTVAAPGIGFGSGDAGFYRTGSNELGAATGGVSGWLMSSTALQVNVNLILAGSNATLDANGDMLLRRIELTANNNAGNALNKLVFRDQDGTAVTGQEIGKIEFETNDAGSPGVGAYLKAKARDDNGKLGLNFGAGVGGSAADVLAIDQDGVVITTTAVTLDANGDMLLRRLLLQANNSAGGALNTLRFRDADGTAEIGQVAGQINFETNDAGAVGIAAIIAAIATSTAGAYKLSFSTGSGGAAVVSLEISTGGNLVMPRAGTGLRLTSPDGLVTKTLTINNAGAEVWS